MYYNLLIKYDEVSLRETSKIRVQLRFALSARYEGKKFGAGKSNQRESW